MEIGKTAHCACDDGIALGKCSCSVPNFALALEQGDPAMPAAARALPRSSTPNAATSPVQGPRAEPFRSAEQAWFWTMGALMARRDGSRSDGPRTLRPCDPDDVVKCLDQLYRRRRIDLVHARILRNLGRARRRPQSGLCLRTLRLPPVARGPRPHGMAASRQGHRCLKTLPLVGRHGTGLGLIQNCLPKIGNKSLTTDAAPP